MPLSSQALRRFVHRALADEAGAASPDRKQAAAAFDALCERLRGRLQPLFGRAAIAALFARALHVSTHEFPWLEGVIAKGSDHCSPPGLQTLAPEVTAELLHDGLAAVLANDIGLLSTFIGEDFVMPLVQQAWGSTSLPRHLAKTPPLAPAKTESDL
jgi:hypothetical protein